MDTKEQLVEKLHSATNILVTVSNSPNVDQLAACIGMTLWLNKTGKHATAVFSGDIPNTLEFLQPETTIEKNTDSLRDFIIALDKSKADKLRYKVEDRVVKIFITPYRTSLSADDLEFSQGDFNVDAVVAIGVTKQEELDQAITSHGRILHDAIVTTINIGEAGVDLGSVNWRDKSSSSLSELVYDVCKTLDANQLDPQIATALLTGVVASTERFSNSKTTPNTMSIAAALMAAGANQQLVANKLEEASAPKSEPSELKTEPSTEVPKPEPEPELQKSSDGTLEIEHELNETATSQNPAEETEDVEALSEPDTVSENPPEVNTSKKLEDQDVQKNSRIVSEPPVLGGTLTANSRPDDQFIEPAVDPFSVPAKEDGELLHRPSKDTTVGETSQTGEASEPSEIPTQQPPPGEPYRPAGISESTLRPSVVQSPPSEEKQTLEDIEEEVDSPHLNQLRQQVDSVLDPNSAVPTSSTTFDPAKFATVESEDHDDDVPGVPPPIVPPDFLPPEPPAQNT